ncbi:helix-turn-helix transcriptional regulator [Pedococcus bigeumensis]|uniref:helix-turn-helix transcriptional regulator n=1 Tax=Pedococcus bigeumensis TaxID=433644 RepID=UPI002FED90E4
MGVVEELARARQTYERGDWVAAFQAWSDVEPGALDAADQTRVAYTAYLLGRREDCQAALQRAFKAHVDAGDPAAAARAALWLAMVHTRAGELSVGGGWAARAQGLLAAAGDVVERGYLSYLQMHRHIEKHEWPQALACAQETTAVGRRFGDADLTALGLSAQGRLTLMSGSVPQGLALFDEAMTAVASGEVSPVWAGDIYCLMIEGCQEVSDFRRATEWTDALALWCDHQPGLVPWTGQCAVHRGQIMALRGAWAEALEELGLALQRYVSADAMQASGLALAERGDVLRLQGQYAAADAAYTEAGTYGFEPQPGLALLWLAQGRQEVAHAAVVRLLAETEGPVPRARLLPAAVQVLLAVGEVERAVECATELTAIARDFGCAAVTAESQDAQGLIRLAMGDAAGALPHLRAARGAWTQLGCPYRAARSQGQLGRCLADLGDAESATRELRGALSTLTGLGAVPDAESVRRLLAPAQLPGGLTEREAQVLRLLASGRSNAQIAAELVLSHKTVARHLSNIYTKLDVTTRTAAAAYAFDHDLA